MIDDVEVSVVDDDLRAFTLGEELLLLLQQNKGRDRYEIVGEVYGDMNPQATNLSVRLRYAASGGVVRVRPQSRFTGTIKVSSACWHRARR